MSKKGNRQLFRCDSCTRRQNEEKMCLPVQCANVMCTGWICSQCLQTDKKTATQIFTIKGKISSFRSDKIQLSCSTL